ncbi:protein-tyrosine-phosphatase MKP1-like [Olea europaea var. sylvestris]|uniref:protein-tyrosine-phosphatase MKP1-like n=1 Tax=Olea europaea var. sylvestris TaxID=158386 RepID=UPI000C1CF150|nr:protein-tyrosine-phosphatase MKP1-like [Olea europaea var. sylvestris]XP_022891457.1 protein-tyrosine-phosphatase MKP1-like [Olea europaea var. sylvestris]XP_022891458.1 protein-tyrosine-phosphatase MKP1-like [Olea europaea var. sylvestris]
MLGEENKDRPVRGSWKTYSRSVSWSDGSPRKTNSRPQWNSKARACLPPLQPLSVTRPSGEEWPRAGSDDIGIWANPPTTPGARLGSLTPRGNSNSKQPPREFEFKKDKLAFFDKECSRILDHVYLGSDAVAKNREILRKNEITHVLNCVGFVCPEYFKNDLVYKTLWLQDSPSEDITSIFYDVFDYFEDVREQGGRVLVHCFQGVSRSSSLVIAYLMWKEGQSFEDAFQHVKAARGVTNPNLGFACQLLQCQKRVHALPPSPSSVLRMYRMAPHSPYDPLHLVPKMLSEPGSERLDSRGAFIVHVPSAIFIWIGKNCFKVMSDKAMSAASQVIRYEKAWGPVITVNEDEETSEFWAALGLKKQLADGCDREITDRVGLAVCPSICQRKVVEYDQDFGIFHKALSGGIVPPFPLSGSGSETCIPARENGWSRLRRKLTSGVMKELVASSKLNCNLTQASDEADIIDTCKEVLLPSSPQCNSPDSFASYKTESPVALMEKVEYSVPLTDTVLSPSPSLSSLDSFSSYLVSKPKSRSTSPSLSPSTSDYSSSFTFSPSSSNWSDLSYLSAHPSPSGLEFKDPVKNGSSEESACLPLRGSSPLPEEAFSATRALRAASFSFRTSPSLAERRGSSPPPRMMLPSVDEASHASTNSMSLSFYIEDEIMQDIEYNNFKHERSLETNREDPAYGAHSYAADNDPFEF